MIHTLFGLVTVIVLHAQTDPREIIRRVALADDRNWQAAKNYGFTERVDARRLDAQGRLKTQDVRSYQVRVLEGSPYRRLSLLSDGPLPKSDETKEQQKLVKNVDERRKENRAQRTQRLTEYAQKPVWQRDVWRELPDAMDYWLAAEETHNGRSIYVIEATPRSGYHAQSQAAKMLRCLHVKLWVDKQDYHLARVEVEAIDTISMGLFLVRVAKGARAVIEQERVTGEVWLPRNIHVLASARIGLLNLIHIDQEITYSEFQPGSIVVSRQAQPPPFPRLQLVK